ncbi:MAG: rRNA maturation RNase YbeY [Peptostreptococcaceae bacterium]|nr:rRNA maturation RNase YbeY [Peptostreptococcaceae bacterium]
MLEFNIELGDFGTDLSEEILQAVQKVGEYILEYENMEGDFEISLTFVDDEEIQNLNREYRQKDVPTDVLSFPMLEIEDFDNLEDLAQFGPILLGDIIISMPTAKNQAKEYGHSIKREIAFLICHSILHLLGYDHIDEDERKEMEKMQSDIMNAVNITRD